MIEWRPCLPEHVRALKAQPQQEADLAFIVGSNLIDRVSEGLAFSGWIAGVCVAAGGIVPKWPGHGEGWCVLTPAVGRELLSVTHFVKGLLDIQPYSRLTTTVLCDFEPGHRWVEMLGFTMECPRMKAYDPAGRDMAQYRRLKES